MSYPLLHHDRFVIHGHRGCRGIMPENTIESFLKALEIGVDAIELDIVVNADRQIVVSHEPWMNSLICLKENGNKITADEEKDFNIYKMTQHQIEKFDCGTKPHLDFPDQEYYKAYKPLLREVIISCEELINSFGFRPFVYNIEVKSDPYDYETYQPNPREFVELLMKELETYGIDNRILIQSFDHNILRELVKANSPYRSGLLVEKEGSPEIHLEKLRFTPDFYNPEYTLIKKEDVDFIHGEGIKMLCWTVNKKEEGERLKSLGVNGIITDYPNLFCK